MSFQPDGEDEVVGTIIRLNRKSVTVATAEGVQWRVAPTFLKRRDDSRASEGRAHENVIDLASHKARR